jgi:hypothetical protein
MPSAYIHLLGAKEMAEDSRLPENVRNCISRNIRWAYIGSLLIDLPFFGRFLFQLLMHILKFPPPFSEWGYILHVRKPVQLGLNLCDSMLRWHTPLNDDQKLSLLAGYFCHVAFDSVIHPFVNQCCEKESRKTGEDLSKIHRRCETYQFWLFLKHDYQGKTPSLLRQINPFTIADIISESRIRPIYQLFKKASLQTHSRCPEESDFFNWIKGFFYYNMLTSREPFILEGYRKKIDEFYRSYYANEDFNFPSLFKKAMECTVNQVSRTYLFFLEGRFDDESIRFLFRDLPERNLAFP